MNEPKKLDLSSLDISDEKKQELLRLFPEIRTEGGKIDFDRLQLALGESVDVGRERYGINWPGKAECFKTIQTPSMATLVPAREESVNFATTENLFIEGDNLEVLKLLQKSYLGKIKMIYIDPPYNTGNDFIYPDNYSESLQTYLEYTGQVDAGGRKFSTNTEADGRFHSKWLNMMYSRLFLARQLLQEDGAICVSIGNEELHNLRTVMNEVFGEENHRNTLAIRRFDKNLSRQFMERGLVSLAVGFEYVLIYSRSQAFVMNPVFREASAERQVSGYWKGFWNAPSRPTMRYNLLGVKPEEGQWKWKEAIAKEAVDNYREFVERFSKKMSLEEYWESTGKTKKFIRRNPNGGGKNQGVEHWIPPSTGILRTSNWTDILASESLASLEIPFDNPKNTELLRNLIRLCCDEEDLILDFFAGACSTAHSVLDLNHQDVGTRRFIMVQLPEPTPEDSTARKAGYKTIADIGKDRIRRVIDKLKKEREGKLNLKNGEEMEDLGFKVFKLAESNFKPWNAQIEHGDTAVLEKQLDLHVDHVRDSRTSEDILYELLLKSGFPTTAPVEALSFVGKSVYSVAGGALFICLERELTLELIRAVAEQKPARVVCLDEGFAGNDQLKANAVQIFKTKGVTSFKTV